MYMVETKTQAEGVEYPISFQQFDTLAEAIEALGGEEGARDAINALQRERALQGRKTEVRKAITKFGADSDEVQEAIAAHQAHAAEFVLGRPRGVRTGLTKTKARKATDKLLEVAGEDVLKEFLEKHGIDPDAL
jgi:hypothetical protein